jgi:hypothetical protein
MAATHRASLLVSVPKVRGLLGKELFKNISLPLHLLFCFTCFTLHSLQLHFSLPPVDRLE